MNNLTTEQTCRSCQQANYCAIAHQQAAEGCWCLSAEPVTHLRCPVPEDTFCLCKNCLQQARQDYAAAP